MTFTVIVKLQLTHLLCLAPLGEQSLWMTVTFQKISGGASTDGVLTATFAPGSAYHFISWYGSATMTFSINPEIFKNVYNNTAIFGESTIRVSGFGRLWGFAASSGQNFEITFSELSAWVCYGITGTLGSDTSDSGFDSGFAGGKGYCIDNVGNVTINVTLSCPENCIACNSSCAVCTGGTNNDCSSCNSGFFLQPFSTTCSSNRFIVIITSYNFHLNHLGCHTSCYTCNGGNSNNCLSCRENYTSTNSLV